MNGIEATDSGLRQSSGCDTNYGEIKNMETAKDLGILYYMGKPFDLYVLREIVREILREYLLKCEEWWLRWIYQKSVVRKGIGQQS